MPDRWYCARAVFHFRLTGTYEERLTLWRAAGFEAAVALAEEEAVDYADSLVGCGFAGLVQAYRLDGEPGPGVEVFSLMRDSPLAPDDYLNRFFDTGAERHGPVGG